MRWELIAYSTDMRFEDIRYRDYTTSEKKAKLFEQIPKIQFTDSGHGIIFNARLCEPGSRLSKRINTLWQYVEKHMRLIKESQQKPKQLSKKDLRIKELEKQLDERFKLYDRYRRENIELRKELCKIKDKASSDNIYNIIDEFLNDKSYADGALPYGVLAENISEAILL